MEKKKEKTKRKGKKKKKGKKRKRKRGREGGEKGGKKTHGESQLARSFERNDRIRSRNGEGPLPRSNKFEGREGKDLSNGMTFPPGSDSVSRGIERERKAGKRKRAKKEREQEEQEEEEEEEKEKEEEEDETSSELVIHPP
ncbi:hypothetical protein V1478_014896 [Vespula squamosa]|uniref:Uncharacterized protein n=1 Tax=Vespula squamosa TaxID=30214 RepID=A0ABD2A3K5_VESSQ